jgi:hypothetical protein
MSAIRAAAIIVHDYGVTDYKLEGESYAYESSLHLSRALDPPSPHSTHTLSSPPPSSSTLTCSHSPPLPPSPPTRNIKPVYGSLEFDRDYVTGCHKLIKQLRLENNVALRGLGAPIKVGGGMGGI